MFVYILIITITILVFKNFLYKIECMFIFHNSKIDTKDYGKIGKNINEYEKYLRKIISKDVSLNEYNIITSDNIRINMLYFNNPLVKNHLIFAHGNAGTIYDKLYIIPKLGKFTNIVLFDYRGYGKSSGSPTEIGVYKDIITIWKFLVKNIKVHPNHITLYGESLGCSIVSWLCCQLCKDKNLRPNCLIMQAGFSNLRNIVKDLFPKFLSYVVRSNFDNIKNLKLISNKVPILIAHSPEDELVNIYHKDLLLEANNNAQYYQLFGIHNNVFIFDDQNFISKIVSYFT